MPVRIVCCYAHEDELQLNEFKSHLKPLERQGLIEVWHDRDISAGLEWEREVSEHLNQAQIILLLISPAFVSSDYCYSVELRRSIERHTLGEARVIPIIIRPVYWEGAPFSKLMVLPIDGKPVLRSSPTSVDEAWLEVVLGIKKVLEDFQASSSKIPPQRQAQDTLNVDKQHINILLIFANPVSTVNIALAREERAIRNVIRSSRYRDHITITSLPAATYEDIQQALLEETFQIAHFAGHASPTEIMLENEMGEARPIRHGDFANLLATYATSLQCVILNAVYTGTISQQLAKHIPFVIGPANLSTDQECIEFSKGFYRAIGFGKSFEAAYQEGCMAVAPISREKGSDSTFKVWRKDDASYSQGNGVDTN